MPEPTTDCPEKTAAANLVRKMPTGFFSISVFPHNIRKLYIPFMAKPLRLGFFSEFPFPFLHPPSIFFSSLCYYNNSNNLLCVQQGGLFLPQKMEQNQPNVHGENFFQKKYRENLKKHVFLRTTKIKVFFKKICRIPYFLAVLYGPGVGFRPWIGGGGGGRQN